MQKFVTPKDGTMQIAAEIVYLNVFFKMKTYVTSKTSTISFYVYFDINNLSNIS